MGALDRKFWGTQMNGEILYQGHGSVRITTKSGKTIYIDPYAGSGYDQPADLILVTHQHYDHTQIDKPPKNSGCEIWQNFDAQKNGQYFTKDFGDVRVEAVEAYNENHPKSQCVGYLLDFDGITVYIAGDTATTEQMSTLADRGIDYAFIPMDGIFTMNAKEASQVAELVGAKHAIPYHISPGRDFDARKAKKFNPKNRLILQAGEAINY